MKSLRARDIIELEDGRTVLLYYYKRRDILGKTNINKLKESFDFLQYLQERYGFKTAAEGGAQA